MIGSPSVRECPRCENKIVQRVNYHFCIYCQKPINKIKQEIRQERLARKAAKRSRSAMPKISICGVKTGSLPKSEEIEIESIRSKAINKSKQSGKISALVLPVKTKAICRIVHASGSVNKEELESVHATLRHNRSKVKAALKVMNADQVAIAAVSQRELSHFQRELLSTYRISSIVENKSKPVITQEQIAKEKKQRELAELRSIAAQVRPIVLFKPTAPFGAVC